MATSKTTRMDAQGRVILPPHIRKELNLHAGQQVIVSLEAGVIQIRPAEDVCALCGKPAKDEPLISPSGVTICRSCAESIVAAFRGGDA